VSRLATFYQSTVGKKVIVAATGLVWLCFLVGHVAGNLKVFLPDPEPGVRDIDAYAEFLRTMGEPLLPHEGALWVTRAVLAVSLVLHVACVLQLSRRNRAARPVRYATIRYREASFSARLMMLSGLVVLAYVVFHVLHLTTGTVDPASFEEGAVYDNLYRAFDGWPLVVAYVAGMAFVAFHLYHAAWSAFQTFGLDNPDRNRGLRFLALALAVLIFIGFVTVPLSFWAGLHEVPSAIAGR
jgi:succinate dehydrogenase / fumarate reductase cytochrome b subunit